ncbi:MAG: hypothetical protein WC373_05235 [Smithella sp.]|jgi:hypothetical protein
MITAAAIKRGADLITGRRHCHCINAAVGISHWKPPVMRDEQGFVNDKGIFLTRAEAAKEAFECGQIKLKYKPEILTSEDLW